MRVIQSLNAAAVVRKPIESVRERARARIAALDASVGAFPAFHSPVAYNPHLEAPENNTRPMLEDRFGRTHDYLRISLTERCNLRCRYCMPAAGVPLSPPDALLSASEIVRVSRALVQRGVRKIRLTGGEPTVRRDMVAIVRELGRLRDEGLEELGLTTNGVALSRHIDALKDAGLTHVNISLDTLRTDRFERLTRRRGLPLVLRAIEDSVAAGFTTRINTVVLRGENDDEAPDFVALTQNLGTTVRFIEFMPFAGNAWSRTALVPSDELLSRIEKVTGRARPVGRAPSATSDLYQIDGFAGMFGFIASMTRPFCGDCSRLRITANGHLKVCLFGARETDLRPILRGDPALFQRDLERAVSGSLARKEAQHAGGVKQSQMPNRPMILIGG